MITRLVFFLTAFFVIAGCERLEKLFVEEDLLERPPSKRCADCHQKIYNQWKTSRHAQAWVSEEFIKKTKNRTKTKCLSCHAPLEVKAGEKPQLRDKLREEGVNCFSCHYREETDSIHGPYKVFSPPHYSTYNPEYTSARICSGCHKKTYDNWIKTGSNKNCQECHMPSKKDRLIQKFPFMYFHSKKDLHNHSFLPLKADEQDFSITVVYKGKALMVSVKNLAVPHTVPTAQQGKPKYYLQIKGFERKETLLSESEMITPENGFEYKREKTFIFYVDKKPDEVVVELYRKLSWKKEREFVLKKRLSID
ncbi:MAG: multiheme c-type cytochrome [Persephonella sp.]|nr:multiheme c-type cytochrome [Persephonella sp.]